MTLPLILSGLVRWPGAYPYAALADLDQQVPDLSQLMPGKRGGGVRLTALLDAAGAMPTSKYLTLESEDGFGASIPLKAVADQSIVAYRDGAAPLSTAAGGPMRFYIVDVAACGVDHIDQCANVKHLLRIHLSAEPGRDTRPTTEQSHEALHERDQRRS